MSWRENLVARYPMLQDGGYPRVGDGWRQILEILCEGIDRESKASGIKIQVTQIKEKYGGLRYYTNVGNDKIFSLIDVAERASEVTCEACGAPGKILILGGWYKACCPQHSRVETWPSA